MAALWLDRMGRSWGDFLPQTSPEMVLGCAWCIEGNYSLPVGFDMIWVCPKIGYTTKWQYEWG
jgi:hypothetical protein